LQTTQTHTRTMLLTTQATLADTDLNYRQQRQHYCTISGYLQWSV